MSRPADFDADMELVFCIAQGGYWSFTRRDAIRIGKLKRSKAFAAMMAAEQARDAAYRDWVIEFGTNNQRVALLKDDEARARMEASA